MGLHPVSEANDSSPFGSLSAAEFYSRHSVAHSSAYITNPTGLKLFTQWWTPLHRPPLGLIAVVHGFTGESSWFLQLTSVLFAKSGFLTCAIDHQGHGLSDGLTAHIPNINLIVDDCISFFDDFRSRHSSSLPSFLYSESLGGAIALYITLRQKSQWNGLILSGAMCSISHKFKPPWPLQHLLTLAATLIPTWRVVPTRGTIAGVSFKEPWKRKLAFANPNRTVGKPRAATAYELVRVCEDLQSRFEEVEVPLMIVHGGDDVVCDPSSVEELYMRCKSRDKTIKIYPGMWHQLIGESEENVDLVFGDVLKWITNRSQNDAVNNGKKKMKDIMKEVEGKVKFSMADSTMMLLVQQAMDKAHEKIKTKHGLLLRLNAISLFYELAVLQLQSCLNFVQQETDNLESNHEEVVRDLRKIKDRLHHRLLETELAILEKDRELLERSENEASLRNVLESKETELVHLQDLERKRSSCNEIIGEEFSELKSSVDHQVMNLRQKIETEYDGLGKEADDPSGVDIDVLKGTMDLAFNKMHHAIFLSELGPIEQSWRWSVERETMGLLIKGFMNGLEEEKKRVMMVVKDYELGFKDKVCLIRREVECLESQIIIHRSSSASPRAITTTSSSVDCEVVNDDKEEEEGEGEEDSSNYPVSKLIKSHESIIRRKSEELVSPKIESIKRQRSCNSSSLKRTVDDIVAGLDSLVCLNTKMFEYFCYDEDDDRCDEKEVVMDDGLDDVWKKVQKHRSVACENEVEEKEDVEMKLMILEDTYLTLLRGLLTDNKKLLVEQGKRACLDTSLVFDDFEILREDEEFRQEVDWIIVRELLREVSETVENQERIQANNKRLLEKEVKRACLDTSLVFDDFEIIREDGLFRQEVDWIVVRELLREVSETVENLKRIEAENKRLLEEQGKRACMDISLVFDDFDFKIQERLKMATLGLQNLEKNIDSTMDYMAELRRKESVYKTAFVLRCENLIKAETEVDLLGDQVDSLVKLLQKTLWTFHQHPLLLCNHSDVNIRSVEGCVDAIKKATKGDSRGLDKQCCDAISGLTNDCLPIIFSGGPAIGLLVKAACTHKFDDVN
ncbi:unnamed protein product [Brassica oleracea var. botrytis]